MKEESTLGGRRIPLALNEVETNSPYGQSEVQKEERITSMVSREDRGKGTTRPSEPNIHITHPLGRGLGSVNTNRGCSSEDLSVARQPWLPNCQVSKTRFVSAAQRTLKVMGRYGMLSMVCSTAKVPYKHLDVFLQSRTRDR